MSNVRFRDPSAPMLAERSNRSIGAIRASDLDVGTGIVCDDGPGSRRHPIVPRTFDGGVFQWTYAMLHLRCGLIGSRC